MANRLHQVLAFVNVAAGSQASLAHQLNINGNALIPDLTFMDQSGFEIVSATSQTVTVQNNNATSASLDVWLYYLNSPDRVFGSSSTSHLTPNPFNVSGGSASGGPTSGYIYNLDTVSFPSLAPKAPSLVHYADRFTIPPVDIANETTAIYVRLNDDTAATTFQYALYIEIPTLQNYTYGGSGIKIIHRGHGDGMFVGLLNGINPHTLVGATNTSPIVCNVPNHGFGQGDIVQISGALGNTAANGVWYGILVIDSDHFSLPSSHGNGVYTANSGIAQDIDPPVGYEAAAWGDGVSGFLASVQAAGGLANWTGFNALYQADATLNYHAFTANDIPNGGFGALKRTGLADTAIDGLTQVEILESLYRMIGGDGGGTGFTGSYNPATSYTIGQTVISGTSAYRALANGLLPTPPSGGSWLDVTDTPNVGRKRVALYNSGRVDLRSLVASSTVTTRDAPTLYQYGSYYSAGAGHDFALGHVLHLVGTTSAQYQIQIGDPGGSPKTVAIFSWDGTTNLLDMQNGNVQGVHTMAFKGADATNSLDLQTGSIANVATISGTLVNLQTSGTQFDHYVNGHVALELLDTLASGDTAMQLRCNVGGVTSVLHVTVGAADSGGTGKRCLVIPN